MMFNLLLNMKCLFANQCYNYHHLPSQIPNRYQPMVGDMGKSISLPISIGIIFARLQSRPSPHHIPHRHISRFKYFGGYEL